MTITVKIDDGKSQLSDLVDRAQAGEDVLIARDRMPVARLTLIPRRPDVEAAIAAIKKSRVGRTNTTLDEILACGRRTTVMAFVPDASVAVAWAFPEENRADADALLDQLRAAPAIPSLS